MNLSLQLNKNNCRLQKTNKLVFKITGKFKFHMGSLKFGYKILKKIRFGNFKLT